MKKDSIKKYSNRVLDGQISAQKKKLKLLSEKESGQGLDGEDLRIREDYKKYIAELTEEKERR